jgi:hypothetical protein
MATYDQLPVYKATYDLLYTIFQLCQNMERDYKFTIGENLKKEVIDLIMNVYRANCREDKRDLIGMARENAEVIRLLLRLLKDLKQIKLEKFVDMNEKLESISKQLAAWHKKQKIPNGIEKTFEGESRQGGFERDLFSESAG